MARKAKGQRPVCLTCAKPLRLTRFGNADATKFGGYGDGRFCGLTCGYRWANTMLNRDPAWEARLHKAMRDIHERSRRQVNDATRIARDIVGG